MERGRQFHNCLASDLRAVFELDVLDRPVRLAEVLDAVEGYVVLELGGLASKLETLHHLDV